MPDRTFILRAAVLALAMALGSCGGGGGGGADGGSGGGGGPVGNRPPVFTSPSGVTFVENTVAPAYIAQATDADGDALVYAVAPGGADNSRFAMRRNGEYYLTGGDYESRPDAGGDNVYELRISVTDGKSEPIVQTVLVTLANGSEYQTVQVASSLFSVPDLKLTAATRTNDGTGRIYTAETGGVIRIWTPGQPMGADRPIFLDLRNSAPSQINIYSMAPAPDFSTSGRFFVLLRINSTDIEVRSYRTFAANRDSLDPSSGDVIFRSSVPCCTEVGWIGFGPDDLLYIGTPVESSGQAEAQQLTSLRGKILRVDIRADAYPADALRDYAIPPTNPYANGGGLAEIWVRGFNNPRSGYFDPTSRNLYITDRTEDRINELNIVRASDGGQDYGFPACANNGPGCAGTLPPVFDFIQAAESGNELTAGLLYRGPFAEIDNVYLLADTNTFFPGSTILEAVENRLLVVGQTLTGTRPSERRFGQLTPASLDRSAIGIVLTEANSVYLVMSDGSIHQLTRR